MYVTGIGREKHHGRPFLTDGGIYQALMSRYSYEDQVKHPQLVSFIGQTSRPALSSPVSVTIANFGHRCRKKHYYQDADRTRGTSTQSIL
jgi:hypothetical protein